jgi:modification methylase
LELNKIHLCDCLDGLRELDDNSIDLVITSPPYNMGDKISGKTAMWSSKVDYDTYSDNKEESEYQQWQIEILNEIHRVLKEGGSLFYNHKVRSRNNIGILPSVWLLKSKLVFRQLIIWDRKRSINVNLSHYLPNTELIYWMTKGNKNVRFSRQRYNNGGKISVLNEIWPVNIDIKNEHPASFPIELVDRIIPSILGTEEMIKELGNIIVLDPFIGSGTTAISAEKYGCNWIGFELSEKYKKIAERRIKNESLKTYGENLFGDDMKEQDFSFEEMKFKRKEMKKEKHYYKNKKNKPKEETNYPLI